MWIFMHAWLNGDCEQFLYKTPETRSLRVSRVTLSPDQRQAFIQRVCFLRGRTTTAAASRAETVSSMTHRVVLLSSPVLTAGL
jgi:hypothetical protein